MLYNVKYIHIIVVMGLCIAWRRVGFGMLGCWAFLAGKDSGVGSMFVGSAAR